eukprot:3874521-Rhodomonas_salina.7
MRGSILPMVLGIAYAVSGTDVGYADAPRWSRNTIIALSVGIASLLVLLGLSSPYLTSHLLCRLQHGLPICLSHA